ncbi:MAG: NUDIX domain-containing protein [Candidatus Pacebacteria bacterium]|jgi:ADP-ribose pyrophosphatase YjhB (NUDIX family)|nr:NUDIX domain-containing protein [Candidatus Paceibacterota bacterium]
MWKIPLEQYKEFHRLMPILCVDGVVVRNNSFLLLKRKNAPAKDEWWFPGGRVLRNELLVDAVKRKIWEETGLESEKLEILGADETLFPDGPFEWSTHTVNIVFKAEAKDGNEKIDDQSQEFQWFEKIDESWPPYVKKFLEKARF